MTRGRPVEALILTGEERGYLERQVWRHRVTRSCASKYNVHTSIGYIERAKREHLEVLDDAAFGGATPVTPKAISSVDPAAR